MKCNFINKNLINSKTRLLKPKKIDSKVSSWICAKNPKTGQIRYVPKFELGELINSGVEANVYCVKDFDDKVARIKKGFVYSPKKLVNSNLDKDTFFSSLDEGIKIQRKIQGEPLYGPFWSFDKILSPDKYLKNLNSMLKLPDEIYLKYIKDVIELRKNGFDIDKINPNNFLLDRKNKKINIVDTHMKKCEAKISMEDFYPFMDEYRIARTLRVASLIKKRIIMFKLRRFVDKIEKLGKKYGYDIQIERDYKGKQMLFDDIVYIYNNDKNMIKLIANKIKK